MEPVVILLVLVVVVAASIFAVIRITGPMAQRKLEGLAATAEADGATLTAQASCYGQESTGPGRGLGVLALGPTTVWFTPVAGDVITIERSAITSVDVVTTFLDKPSKNDLVQISWTPVDGEPDAAAFRLVDTDDWTKALP